MGFGKRLKEILKERNMTIKELSKLSGISQNTLYSITKRDNTLARFDIVEKIASVLDISPQELIISKTGNDKNIQAKEKKLLRDPREDLLIEKFNTLNDKGKDKAVEQVDMITRIFEYKKRFEPVLNAAHDDGATPEQKKHADDIMSNPDE